MKTIDKAKLYESLIHHPGWAVLMEDIENAIRIERKPRRTPTDNIHDVNFSNGVACGLEAALSITQKTIKSAIREDDAREA